LFYGLCSEEDYADATKIGWYFRPSPNDVIGMDMESSVDSVRARKAV
jgi:hypothetical protein